MRLLQASSLALLLAPSFISAQKLIIVFVGRSGNQLANVFEPSSIQADVGDSIQFQFYPRNHSIVQGNPDRPCIPNNPLGFYSGFQSVQDTDESYPTFTVNVENTDPMYFYCSQGRHCQGGMVGVINPPSTGGVSLDDYRGGAQRAISNISPGQTIPVNNVGPDTAASSSTAAPSATGTTTTTGPATQTGGAFGGIVSSTPLATAPPANSGGNSPAFGGVVSSLPSSPTSTSAPAAKSSIAPIVGGIVGGVAALVGGLIVALWLIVRKKRRNNRVSEFGDIGYPKETRQSEMYGGNFSRGGMGGYGAGPLGGLRRMMEDRFGGARGERI